jgi:hypothetical protein
MKTDKIKTFEKKVQKEVQRAIDVIYKKHNKAMVELIAQQIPKGKRLTCGNGMSILGKESGRAWGVYSEGDNDILNYLSSLQYLTNFEGGFNIPRTIFGQCTKITKLK